MRMTFKKNQHPKTEIKCKNYVNKQNLQDELKFKKSFKKEKDTVYLSFVRTSPFELNL